MFVIVDLSSCSKDSEDNEVPVQSIRIKGDKEISITAGDNITLETIITPENATNKAVKWKSSDNEIADVNTKRGVVTALKEGGPVTITVTTLDGNKTASCNVTVTNAPIAVNELVLSATELKLNAEVKQH